MSLPIDTAILSLKVGPSDREVISLQKVDSLVVLDKRRKQKVSAA